MINLQYGKTKAEREQVIIMGPKRYRFDGESTMDKFTSEHPVQMSQVSFFTCQILFGKKKWNFVLIEGRIASGSRMLCPSSKLLSNISAYDYLQDTFRAVMKKAKKVAPMKFVKSEDQVTIGDSANMRNVHLHIVPKSKSLPVKKRDFEYKVRDHFCAENRHDCR